MISFQEAKKIAESYKSSQVKLGEVMESDDEWLFSFVDKDQGIPLPGDFPVIVNKKTGASHIDIMDLRPSEACLSKYDDFRNVSFS